MTMTAWWNKVQQFSNKTFNFQLSKGWRGVGVTDNEVTKLYFEGRRFHPAPAVCHRHCIVKEHVFGSLGNPWDQSGTTFRGCAAHQTKSRHQAVVHWRYNETSFIICGKNLSVLYIYQSNVLYSGA